jgi:hypothetical protein
LHDVTEKGSIDHTLRGGISLAAGRGGGAMSEFGVTTTLVFDDGKERSRLRFAKRRESSKLITRSS